jgi:hypothetical protein
MIITGAAESVYARATARPRRRVELLNACSGLGSGSARESRLPMVNRRDPEGLAACHFETRAFPDIVESRLSSAFVAQILGQDLLTKRRDASLGGRAYAQALRDEAPVQRLLRLV